MITKPTPKPTQVGSKKITIQIHRFPTPMEPQTDCARCCCTCMFLPVAIPVAVVMAPYLVGSAIGRAQGLELYNASD